MDISTPGQPRISLFRRQKIEKKHFLKTILIGCFILAFVFIVIDIYLIAKLPDTLTAPISLPARLPATFRIDPDSLTTFRWVVNGKLRQKIDITYINKNNDKFNLKIIRPNDSLSCRMDPELAKKEDPDFISYKELSHPKIGQICFETFKRKGEIYQQYQWKESDGLYSLYFKKGLVSEKEASIIFSALNQVQMPTVNCSPKLNCLMYIIGLIPF